MRGKRDLNRLAWDFVNAAVARFLQMEIWPRPPGSRSLQAGTDFYYPDLDSIPEFSALRSFLEQWEDQVGGRAMDVAVNTTLAVIHHSTGEEPDPVVCRRVVDVLWQELGRRTALLREVVPLVGLRLEASEMRLDSKAKVLHQSLNSEGLLDARWPGSHHQAHVNSAFVFEERVPKRPGWTGPVEAYSRLDALLSAIRLYCPGVTQAGRRYSFQVAGFPLSEPLDWYPGEFEPQLAFRDSPCRLAQDDASTVERLWLKLYSDHYSRPRGLGAIDESRLDVALKRFNRTYGPHDWIENLVDLTICLEALLGPTDRRELTHRLRLRAALLFGRTDEEVDDLYDLVSALYEIRSRVVHGSGGDERALMKSLYRIVRREPQRHEVWWDLAPEAVGRARTLARRCLRSAVELYGRPDPEPRWPLPDDIDKLLATPTGRERWQAAALDAPLQESLPHYSEPPREAWYD